MPLVLVADALVYTDARMMEKPDPHFATHCVPRRHLSKPAAVPWESSRKGPEVSEDVDSQRGEHPRFHRLRHWR